MEVTLTYNNVGRDRKGEYRRESKVSKGYLGSRVYSIRKIPGIKIYLMQDKPLEISASGKPVSRYLSHAFPVTGVSFTIGI